jgi:uncharacterized protein (TIGR01777 family)
MHVAVTGSTGFIGEALVSALHADGHTVTRIVRRPPQHAGELRWDIDRGEIDADGLRGVDAVVHLAGEGIAERRWTDAQKQRILRSRTEGTRLIADAVAGVEDGPRVLVCASGINFYGDRGDEVLTEDSGPGEGFLTKVVMRWEGAAAPARDAGVRVVHTRFGIVQSAEGGALGRMLPLFKLGLGGRLGTGRQYWSWVSREDVVGIVSHALVTPELVGPVNVVAPNPVTNAEYARTLAKVLGRPAVLPIPKLGPAVLFGWELTTELLFASERIIPERVLASGYEFVHTNLEQCLRDVLDRPASG